MSTSTVALPGASGTSNAEDVKDLGFGSRVAADRRGRLLNRDGTFNVARSGLPWWRTFDPYEALVSMTWPRFFASVCALYLATNLTFALAYLACGPGALAGGSGDTTLTGRVGDAFFFSVQTLATIGYGRITPEGLAANSLVALEALVGIVGFAIATGLAFARFSRPTARIQWSARAVIAPHRGGRAFMFRLANQGRNQLLQVQAQVIYSRFVESDGRLLRRFDPLVLERAQVMFLPLHWTVVHAITSDSPLHGSSAESLRATRAEFLVLLTAVDEAFSQTVYARTSYDSDDIVHGARFVDMYHADSPLPSVDLRRLHLVETASLGFDGSARP
jgi:inward rectifier potassium channel